MTTITVIRIDPFRRTIASMRFRAPKDATPGIRKILRASGDVGSRVVATVEQGEQKASLLVISSLNADEAWPRWRLRGCEDTAGIALITGQDPADKRLVDCPVRRGYIEDRIQWLDGESDEDCAARAAEMLDLLNSDVRAAIVAAVVVDPGSIWIPATHLPVIGGPMQTLGLGTERSKGQHLTNLGIAVHALLTTKESTDV